ncbi:DUF4760 domain-containing protein [Legionella resiliens]|uniref:DUF4760 domain-containing protein n=1 Tax=Legionella resiliens TaxID=2905958 RepID=A0ABS8X5L0_9GAMM|nr:MULTISPECIES: DUF4760 domain-containing protein [unclassified Legionella]MCE0723983.1 DUF4760 domain-containing protein [Legionella sp. 9fVS26]MCE3533136.1 DUF4760 domain-containing protein [Legionella sp. 8cVS16]
MLSKKQIKKNVFKSCKTLGTLVFYIIIFGFPIFLIIMIGEGRYYDIFHTKIGQNHVSDWNDIVIIFLTLFIVCAGWLQFKNLNKTSTGDFLLRIDERFGSPEILRARAIIHEFYCLTYEKEIDINIHTYKIAEKVLSMKNKVEASTDFIYLYNFLNFLETIAYFANNKYISSDEVNELLGGSLKYYYLVFKLLIADRRKKYQSNYYYCELETLAKAIHKKNPSQPPFINY